MGLDPSAHPAARGFLAVSYFWQGGTERSRPFPTNPLWSKAKSVGAHSICARGGLSCRKRARADMESAPTFFVGATIGRPCPFVLRGGFGIFVGMGLDPSAHPAVRCFLAVSYFGQGGTERSRPFPTNLRFFASLGPKYSCPPHGSLPHRLRAEPPRRGGQERRAVFDYLRRIFFSFALSKTVIYGILFFYRSTGKPGANRRRKAIGAHRVSQLPTSNCCFYCRPQLRVLFGAGVDEGESTAIHRRHKAGHL